MYTKEYLAEAKERMVDETLYTLERLADRKEFQFLNKIIDWEQGVPNTVAQSVFEQIKEEALAKANSFKRDCLSKAKYVALEKFLRYPVRWCTDVEDFLDYEDQIGVHKYGGHFWKYQNYLLSEIGDFDELNY